MYSYISGTLEEVREEFIVVDNHGIGYQLMVPLRIHDDLPPVGSQVKIYTYLHVREDAFLLYGFLSRDEIAMFRMLLGVSGIGPKGATALLSAYPANEIRLAVVSGDDGMIAKAPGIGKKTAQRLIIELRDKVSPDDIVGVSKGSEPAAVYDENSIVRRETTEALTALGYSASEARRVLAGIEISGDDDVEQVLRQALKNMAML